MDIFNGDHQWSGRRAPQQGLGDRRELARPAIEDDAADTARFHSSKRRRFGRLVDRGRQHLVQLAKDFDKRPHRCRHVLEELAAKARRAVRFEFSERVQKEASLADAGFAIHNNE